MPRYDIELIKQAAHGRWHELLSSAAAVDISVFDGRHHPCPKCGGTDRFRALDDFSQSGAVFCNQCFTSKNGDGFAAYQWLTGLDFGKAIDAVAKYLGVKPEKKKRKDPFADLEELPWNATAAGLWCQKKLPISSEAMLRLGVKFCRYRRQYTVFAVPVWGPQVDANPAVGWILYRTDGGQLPRGRRGETEWVKVKLAEGSEKGIVVDLDAWRRRSEVDQWWKLEGSTDLLTALSVGFPEGHAFFTTANGAKEIPEEWIIEELADCKVHVCHDSDIPGQEGATWVVQSDNRRRAGWAPSLARRCKEVRNVRLPFAIEPNHGPDIRDFFSGGGTVDRLLELAADSELFPMEAATQASEVPKDIASCTKLAEDNLSAYRREQLRNLVFWRNEWYRYRGTRYERMDPEHLRIRVRTFIQDRFERAWRMGEDDRDTVRDCSEKLVSETISSMKTMCLLSSSAEDSDCWIDENTSSSGVRLGYKEVAGPNDCVAFANKILSLKSFFSGESEDRFLHDHTSRWFSMQCLPYEFDPKRGCDAWQDFLWQVFANEEAIEALQRWFGYLLLPETSLEKMLYVIGPTRSGKGTIMKVMMALFGQNQVASPTLGSLIGQYALHGLYGKTIAVIPDARLSRRADRETITERLLSLVANDPQDIERKYLSTMTGVRMNVRFTLFSNKLPDLDDSTAAMVGRGIYLLMNKSFLGQEDYGLLDRLLAELPGILNWAMVGRHKLQKDRRIQQPAAYEHVVRKMRVSMAPVSQFIFDCCDLAQDEGMSAADLFDAWCHWASENAYVNKMSVTDFERRAVDAFPFLRAEKTTTGGFTNRKLIGVKLKR